MFTRNVSKIMRPLVRILDQLKDRKEELTEEGLRLANAVSDNAWETAQAKFLIDKLGALLSTEILDEVK